LRFFIDNVCRRRFFGYFFLFLSQYKKEKVTREIKDTEEVNFSKGNNIEQHRF